MVRRLLVIVILGCILMVLSWSAPVAASDDWSALGTYTQVLAQERLQRAHQEYQRSALALDTSSPASDYWYRRHEFYLDRSYHQDMRIIENEARRITGEPFVSSRSVITTGRGRELYMQHRRLNNWLDQREWNRTYYPHSYGYGYPSLRLRRW